MNPTKTTSGATKVLQECGIRSCRIKSLKLRRYISSSSLAETLLLDGWYLGDEGRSEMIKEFSDSGGVVAGRCRLALVLKTFFMIATPGSQTSRGPRRILDNTPSLPSRVQNSLSSPPPSFPRKGVTSGEGRGSRRASRRVGPTRVSRRRGQACLRSSPRASSPARSGPAPASAAKSIASDRPRPRWSRAETGTAG